MPDLAALARRLDELEREQNRVRGALAKAERERELAEAALDEYQRLYLEMMERCRKLERGLLGQKAERLGKEDKQLSLGVLEMMLGESAAAAIDALPVETVRTHERRKPTGRKAIPDKLILGQDPRGNAHVGTIEGAKLEGNRLHAVDVTRADGVISVRLQLFRPPHAHRPTPVYEVIVERARDVPEQRNPRLSTGSSTIAGTR